MSHPRRRATATAAAPQVAPQPPLGSGAPPSAYRLWAGIYVVVIVGAVALGYVGINALRVSPIGDTAGIIKSARLVLLEHPQVGQGSTAYLYGNPASSHPGPIELYLAYPFLVVFGVSAGSYIFALSTAVLSILLSGWAALRTAGPRAGIAFLVAGAAVGGFAIPHLMSSMNITYVCVLPLFACYACAWAVADGRWWFLPVLVGVASFVMQTETVYIAPLLPVLVAAPCFGLWRARRGLRPASAVVPSILVTLVTAGLAWALPLDDELFGSHNLGKLASASIPSRGWHGASQAWGTLLSLPPNLDGSYPIQMDELRTVGIGSVLVVVLLAGALVRRRHRVRELDALLVVAAAVFLGAGAAGAILPRNDTSAWHLLWLRADLVFIATALLLAITNGVAVRRPALRNAILALGLSACAALLSGATSVRLAGLEGDAARAVGRISPQIRRTYRPRGATIVTFRGVGTDSIAPGVALRLVGQNDQAVASRAPFPSDATVLVVTRGGRLGLPGGRRIAGYPASSSAATAHRQVEELYRWARSHGPLTLNSFARDDLAFIIDGLTPSFCLDDLVREPSRIFALDHEVVAALYAENIVTSPRLPPTLVPTSDAWTHALGVDVWELPGRPAADRRDPIFLSRSSCPGA